MQRPETWKILTAALALTGLAVLGAGPAVAGSTPPAPVSAGQTILADDDDWDDWDDWDDDDDRDDDDWDDDDRWDD